MMKRTLGLKKKRRQPTTGVGGVDDDEAAGLQGFGGLGGLGGISTSGSGSRSSTASARYQYALRQYQEAADPLRGDVDGKTFDRYENPMNDAHARGGRGHEGQMIHGVSVGVGSGDGDGSSSSASMAGASASQLGESSLRRRTQEVATAGGGGGAGHGGGNEQPPSFEELASLEGPSEGYVPPTAAGRTGQSPHDAPPASSAGRSDGAGGSGSGSGGGSGGEGGPMMSPAIDHDNATSTHSTAGTNTAGGSQYLYASGSGSACPPDPQLPDITYEEHYGDAYVGKPLKYIYPAGYQSMRPRSRPWKLSIVVFVLFMWLTVFIVGYCSDVAGDQYMYLDDSIDDDAVVIETRWCGSRALYGMWVMSVLITGLSLAYCSIIGYIQVRDFSIANSRSQPPEMAGRSDYYVKVADGDAAGGGSGGGGSASGSGRSSYSSYQDGYGGESTIYQADGTPQFWGNHIYKPTQAAVAVTSR